MRNLSRRSLGLGLLFRTADVLSRSVLQATYYCDQHMLIFAQISSEQGPPWLIPGPLEDQPLI